MDEVLTKMSNLQKSQVEKSNENWKIRSAERLEKIVKTKMTTLMIGSLNAIENTFGNLWGHDSGPGDNEQRLLAKEWQFLRQLILDLGNKQIRAVQKELQQYDIDWTKYQGVGRFTEKEQDNG